MTARVKVTIDVRIHRLNSCQPAHKLLIGDDKQLKHHNENTRQTN